MKTTVMVTLVAVALACMTYADWMRVLQITADSYARMIDPNFYHEIEISVEPPTSMPDGGKEIVAHTTRKSPFSNTCTLHLSAPAAEAALPHEVCHCVLDWDVTGPIGYTFTSKIEKMKHELRASRCERWLLSRDLDTIAARRMGRAPREVLDLDGGLDWPTEVQ